MITVPEIVTKIVTQSPYLEEAMSKDLINLSALARQIQPEVQEELMKEIQVGAIVMALKRMSPTLSAKNVRVEDFIKKLGDITVKSNLVEYTFQNSERLMDKEHTLLQKAKNKQVKFITISQGVSETTIIANSSLKEDIELIFESENLILSLDSLSSITITLPPQNVEISGVYYTILKILAWNGLNIIDAVSTSNEITIIFRDVDIDKAFSVLKRLTKD